MLILSLDTSTRTGSAALLDGESVLVERAGRAEAKHGERLPLELMAILEEADRRVQDVGLFAVAAGPGSFTGLRVGIATMQGLAMANGRQVSPVSTLDALARSVTPAADVVGAWIDAQRGEVFAALYAADGSRCLSGPTSLPPAATLDAWSALVPRDAIHFVGDGAVRYSAAIAAVHPGARVEPAGLLAGVIGRIAAAEPGRGVLPHAVAPIYVRRADAELTRHPPASQAGSA